MTRKTHDVDDETIYMLEHLQFNAFTDGWIAGQLAARGDMPGVSGLEHRLNAARAYNEQHGTDHMGDMLRRVDA